MHHASWMSKVIYALKVWMFRGQFRSTPHEEKGLHEFCLFTIYLKAWFTAPLAACAPRNDLQLLKDLQTYQDIHANVSKATSAKLGLHLWYLSEQLLGLAFFDRNVSAATKREGSPRNLDFYRYLLPVHFLCIDLVVCALIGTLDTVGLLKVPWQLGVAPHNIIKSHIM